MPSNQLLATALRRAPYMIFSKTAPRTLPKYDVDRDFTYFFFNDAMKHFSGISPAFLTSGGRNAKTDFPIDYEAYFEDDAAVCMEYPHPEVKVITEPWKTPAMRTIVETRKTAMTTRDGRLFMVGAFCPHDDVELGITEFRAEKLPPALTNDEDKLEHVPPEWYGEAFVQLPMATLIMEGGTTGRVISRNVIAEATGLDPTLLKDQLGEVDSLPDYESYHFGSADLGGIRSRVWCWRPDVNDQDIIAVSARPTHDGVPQLVREHLP